MIVEEIMEDGMNDATIVYSNDGSTQSGVGKNVVQSLTVNGVKRVLSAFGIFTESQQSLTDLIKDTCIFYLGRWVSILLLSGWIQMANMISI